jgi:hypothetical protein
MYYRELEEIRVGGARYPWAATYIFYFFRLEYTLFYGENQKYNSKEKKCMEIFVTIKIEDGEPAKVDVTQIKKETVDTYSQYARFFDESCPAWSENAESNLMYLKLQETYANDVLKSKGHMFLNEVYDMLGLPKTKAGQVVGWIYEEQNPIGDNRIDFGLTKEQASEFVNGYRRTVLLDFNVDGMILDKIP